MIKTWDVATEQLLDMHDADEAERYADGVRRFEFDAFLAPYDLSSFRAWAGLSRHISAALIASLSPVGAGGNISIMAEADDPELAEPKTEAERKLVQQLQEGRARLAERQRLQQQEGEAGGPPSIVTPGPAPEVAPQPEEAMQVEPVEAATTPSGAATAAVAPSALTPPAAAAAAAGPSGRCFYTRLPGRLLKQRGLTAAELTAANLDKSAALLAAVGQRYGSGSSCGSLSCMEGLLGELQFAFAAFVFGQSLDGFSQVKGGAVFENQHPEVWG